MRHFPARTVPRTGTFALLLAAAAVVSFAQTPAILANGVVNAGDYSTALAPGAIVSIFGTNLASASTQATALPLPSSLGGTSVDFVAGDGTTIPLPLFFVSPGQINAQLPYGIQVGSAQLRVRTSAAASTLSPITLLTAAPRIFTGDFTGSGKALMIGQDFRVVDPNYPVAPAEVVTIYLNGGGAVNGNVAAGSPAPGANGTPLATINAPVTISVGGTAATVTYAGLAPNYVGLYQINFRAPFVILSGAVPLTVTVGGISTQASVSLDYRQLGFYYAVLGGKIPTGQTSNAVSGTGSSIAFRQSDALSYGTEGYNAWSKNLGLSSVFSGTAGEAFTFRNNGTTVFDNNGIDAGSYGSFYDNTNGTSNSTKPGLADSFSMSNYFPLLTATYFQLSASTAITDMVAYFDANGHNDTLPFDPANPYLLYRMNIWSNTSGNMPKETGNFVGDIFSTDKTAGTFTISDTGVDRLFLTNGAGSSVIADRVDRVTFHLATPITLPAGAYWFASDAAVRSTPASSSVAPAATGGTTITMQQYRQLVQDAAAHPTVPRKITFLGHETTVNSKVEITPVTVRPDGPVRLSLEQ